MPASCEANYKLIVTIGDDWLIHWLIDLIERELAELATISKKYRRESRKIELRESCFVLLL